MLLPASILALLSVHVAAVSLVTVATDATEGFCDLAWSAIVHGHVLHVLEWASAGAEFTVATSKMEALAAFAREAAATSPDELVLTVDGYDVIVQASPAAITRQVREVAPGVALGDTVLFSGENYCAPSFSLGGRPRCVAAYPKAAYHVSCSADHSMYFSHKLCLSLSIALLVQPTKNAGQSPSRMCPEEPWGATADRLRAWPTLECSRTHVPLCQCGHDRSHELRSESNASRVCDCLCPPKIHSA